MPKLTPAQIQQKLQEGRNYKLLYRDLKLKYNKVTSELKVENKVLRQLVAVQQAQLDKQAIQIAELQTMVFGKKKQPPMGGTSIAPELLATPKQSRTPDSYRRPVPLLPMSLCRCLQLVPVVVALHPTLHERYQEDIPLPELTPNYQAKLVTKYIVERGICLACGKTTTGNNTDLGGAQVALGPNVRLLATHLVSVDGLSYAQVVHLMLSLYGLRFTDAVLQPAPGRYPGSTSSSLRRNTMGYPEPG